MIYFTSMWVILIISFFLFIITLSIHFFIPPQIIFYALNGDGVSLLETTSDLIVIWTLISGLSFSAFGAMFGLSNLSAQWKLRIIKIRILKELIPFLIILLISGAVPFYCIFNLDTKLKAGDSQLTVWLILDFLLLILLAISAVKASLRIYDNLSLLTAIRSTLGNIDLLKIYELKEASVRALKDDFERRERIAWIPMTGFGRDIVGNGSEVHNDLLLVFLSLLKETNPQILDSGVEIISNWLKKYHLGKLDHYFEYRLIPACFNLIKTDQNYSHEVIKIRLYYLSLIIRSLQENGAILTGSNAANPIYEIINEYSMKVGVIRALESAELCLNVLIAYDYMRSPVYSMLLFNILKFIPRLIQEKNEESLYWLDKIMTMIRFYLENGFYRFGYASKKIIIDMIDNIKEMYEDIEIIYGEDKAITFGLYDYRYWILVTLRRMQESFVDSINPKTLKEDLTDDAIEIYEYFQKAIDELSKLRTPNGDRTGYKNIKYINNPYLKEKKSG